VIFREIVLYRRNGVTTIEYNRTYDQNFCGCTGSFYEQSARANLKSSTRSNLKSSTKSQYSSNAFSIMSLIFTLIGKSVLMATTFLP